MEAHNSLIQWSMSIPNLTIIYSTTYYNYYVLYCLYKIQNTYAGN